MWCEKTPGEITTKDTNITLHLCGVNIETLCAITANTAEKQDTMDTTTTLYKCDINIKNSCNH